MKLVSPTPPVEPITLASPPPPFEIQDGYFVWNRGTDAKLSKHFYAKEFECQCKNADCVTQRIAVELVQKLETCREKLGYSILINSGFRCTAHQQYLKSLGLNTAKVLSQHELGRAADISCHTIKALQNVATEEFKAMGIARRFLHVDLRADKKRRWVYVK
jgi:uncharacterized protein YcbK (DUF882 family)